MNNSIVSTSYVPLQPPYQIIKYDEDVAMQIGTLIVTIQKGGRSDEKAYKISTHSHPVVAYENKNDERLTNEQLTTHQFLEGAVWNNVEVKDVLTVCLTGATLTWKQFIEILEQDTFTHRYRTRPHVMLYWQLKKLGVTVLPPEDRTCYLKLHLAIQPEEAGLSLQTDHTSPIYLNVSVVEDDYEEGVFSYNAARKTWYSSKWINDADLELALHTQLLNYKNVLRDLLYNEEDSHFTVTYATDADQFEQVVKSLNEDNFFVNLAYNSEGGTV